MLRVMRTNAIAGWQPQLTASMRRNTLIEHVRCAAGGIGRTIECCEPQSRSSRKLFPRSPLGVTPAPRRGIHLPNGGSTQQARHALHCAVMRVLLPCSITLCPCWCGLHGWALCAPRLRTPLAGGATPEAAHGRTAGGPGAL